MKKNTRKGFTITELVIVIAVIAILAAVLIPTFSTLITKANKSAALQEARAYYTEYTGMWDYTAGNPAKDLVIKVSDTEYLIVDEAQMQDEVYETEAAAYGALNVTTGGKYILIEKATAQTGGTEKTVS